MPLQQIHLRINDAATGQPTPVRLRVTNAARTYYPPNGRAADFATGAGEDVGGNLMLDRDRWAYIDGSCEIAVPPGELMVEATKGPEYRPLQEKVSLPAGKLALRLTIERWTDQRAEGWYSGDTRAHSLSPHAALLEAAAEDLAVVNVLARETRVAAADGHSHVAYPNLIAFSGQQPCLERDGHLVAVNTQNTHPILGRLGLLHCHRIVYPLTFGGHDATDDWSLDDWCGQCHRKRGLVVWTDAFDPKVGHAGEALAALILGHIDAFEIDPASPQRLRAWYQLLNAGIRVPLVGASAKDSNRTPLGAIRTYARCKAGEPFSYAAWIDAVRSGYTFISAGPASLTFAINGVTPGSEIRNDGGPLRATASVGSAEPVERMELLVNGAVAATETPALIEHEFDLPAGGWVAVRCRTGGQVLAHTSPIYVASKDGSLFVDPAVVGFLDGHLVRTREWVETEGRFENPKFRERLLGIFDAARQILLQRRNRT
jgi:hypothetical protein